MLNLEIQNHQQEIVPSDENMQHWSEIAYQGEGDASVSIRIVDAAESQALNNEYRHKDKPTNVLSFPMDMPDDILQLVEINMLGDLVICAEVVRKEAEQQHKTTDAHWAHMLVHGMLHLQGYDHIEDNQAQQMEALEISLLNKLGFENPYQS